jgi:hypothetical protein
MGALKPLRLNNMFNHRTHWCGLRCSPNMPTKEARTEDGLQELADANGNRKLPNGTPLASMAL